MWNCASCQQCGTSSTALSDETPIPRSLSDLWLSFHLRATVLGICGSLEGSSLHSRPTKVHIAMAAPSLNTAEKKINGRGDGVLLPNETYLNIITLLSI